MPDETEPFGGVFYIGRLFVFRMRLPVGVKQDAGRLALPPTVGEPIRMPHEYLSDLHYDARTHLLYALFSPGDLVVKMTLEGKVVAEFPGLRGDNQKGLCIAPEGSLYIAMDRSSKVDPERGTLWKYITISPR